MILLNRQENWQFPWWFLQDHQEDRPFPWRFDWEIMVQFLGGFDWAAKKTCTYFQSYAYNTHDNFLVYKFDISIINKFVLENNLIKFIQ